MLRRKDTLRHEEILDAIRRLGAQGGQAAAKRMTKRARKKRAKKAAAARWRKAKKRR